MYIVKASPWISAIYLNIYAGMKDLTCPLTQNKILSPSSSKLRKNFFEKRNKICDCMLLVQQVCMQFSYLRLSKWQKRQDMASKTGDQGFPKSWLLAYFSSRKRGYHQLKFIALQNKRYRVHAILKVALLGFNGYFFGQKGMLDRRGLQCTAVFASNVFRNWARYRQLLLLWTPLGPWFLSVIARWEKKKCC